MAMKPITKVLLVLSLAIPLAHADEWSKTYKLTGQPDLKVDSTDAEIRVDTWDQNTIEAKVTTQNYKIGEGGIRILEHQNGDQVQLEVRFPREVHFFSFHSYHVQIDIHMPRVDGIEFLRQFKACDENAHSIVILSADPEIDDVARRVGAVGKFRKPFELAALVATVTALAKRERPS